MNPERRSQIRPDRIRKKPYEIRKRMDKPMKKRFGKRTAKLAALVLTAGLMLTGCGSTNSGTTGTSGENPGSTVTPDKPAYTQGITNLSASVKKIDVPETPFKETHAAALSKSGEKLLQKILEISKDPNGNYLISPLSIQMALGMVAAGSDEGSRTRQELMSVLMPGSSEAPSALSEEMATLANRMEGALDVKWNVANSIWVNDNGRVKLRDSYIGDVTNYYNAELYGAPFDQSTIDAINGWVNENTNGMIPQIINDLSPDARIALVNALAFEGEWAVQYEENDIDENGIFKNADGSESKVTMLHSQEAAAIHLAGGLGFIKNYKGGKFSFVGILPEQGTTTEAYMKKLAEDPGSFAEAFKNADYSKDVYATMPEFKTEYGLCMDETLKQMGMSESYSDDAKFAAMVTDDSMPVKIGTVIHKTLIDVSRKGTKAAAATVVVMDEACAEPDFDEPYYITLDRPFVYAIVDNESGVPIFLGVQNTMN